MAGRMTPLALMMMRGGDEGRRGGDGERYRMGYEPWEHERAGMRYIPPYGEPDMRRRNYPRSGYDGEMPEDRRMGFGERDGYETEMRRRRRADGTYMHHGAHEEEYGGEPIRFGGMVSMERGRGGRHKLTREMAEDWVAGLEGSDPAKQSGGKWTMEQVKPIAQKYGVPTEGERFYEFWAVMNALYSDYYAVAKKYNTLSADFFADMAMAFISDKDAVENKSMMYYECIVQK